ncbi:MAG: hypothetical protein ACYC9S_06855 [Leptospirales bacterium]
MTFAPLVMMSRDRVSLGLSADSGQPGLGRQGEEEGNMKIIMAILAFLVCAGAILNG